MVAPVASSDKQYGMWVVVIGLMVLAFTIGVSVARWTAASDVVSVITAVGSVIGTLVGAFFGIETGSAGKKDADKRAADAQDKLAKFALLHDRRDPAARTLLDLPPPSADE